MGFKCEDIWHDIPVAKLSKGDSPPKDFFRISLSNFLDIWSGFRNFDVPKKQERLERIFNTDYFDDYIVLTDECSISKLAATTFSNPSGRDGSGFIYVYTYEDNVLAGMYKEGYLVWQTTRYEAKFKIGRTGQHPFSRINQQLNTRTNIPEPPILLAVLWTNLVAPCERDIHEKLTKLGKRLVDNRGNKAKGGVEWFKDTPTKTLPIIKEWVQHYRTFEVSSSYDDFAGMIKDAYFSDRLIHLLYSEGWLVIDFLDIQVVEFKSSNRVIIRLINYCRYVLDLSKFKTDQFEAFIKSFEEDFKLIRSGAITTYERKWFEPSLVESNVESEYFQGDLDLWVKIAEYSSCQL